MRAVLKKLFFPGISLIITLFQSEIGYLSLIWLIFEITREMIGDFGAKFFSADKKCDHKLTHFDNLSIKRECATDSSTFWSTIWTSNCVLPNPRNSICFLFLSWFVILVDKTRNAFFFPKQRQVPINWWNIHLKFGKWNSPSLHCMSVSLDMTLISYSSSRPHLSWHVLLHKHQQQYIQTNYWSKCESILACHS